MDELLRMLPLNDDAKDAILHHEGAMGAVLRCVMAYERGEWSDSACLHLKQPTVANAYLDAVAWVTAQQDIGQFSHACGSS